MQFVIGLVGEKGSGKGSFAAMLLDEAKRQGMHAVIVRFSDLLRETLALWHLPTTRANLQNLSKAMVAEYGPGTLANATAHRIAESAVDVVILDGVRWEPDRQLVRSFPKNLLVYVTADAHLRFSRIQGRGENADDHKQSFERFMAEEQALSERAIPVIGATADLTIRNEGTMEEFRARCTEVLARGGVMG